MCFVSQIRKEPVASEGLEILNTISASSNSSVGDGGAKTNLPPTGELVRRYFIKQCIFQLYSNIFLFCIVFCIL